ncbi:hypothetical protein JCM16814_33870 [Desulfobaculum senezii]|jgi:hypothetical protein
MLEASAHAQIRMAQRGISYRQVRETVLYGKRRSQFGGRVAHRLRRIVVITDGVDTVITAWRMPRGHKVDRRRL